MEYDRIQSSSNSRTGVNQRQGLPTKDIEYFTIIQELITTYCQWKQLEIRNKIVKKYVENGRRKTDNLGNQQIGYKYWQAGEDLEDIFDG